MCFIKNIYKSDGAILTTIDENRRWRKERFFIMINNQLKRGKSWRKVINFKFIFFPDSWIQFRRQKWLFPLTQWNIKPSLIDFIFESCSGNITQWATKRILFLTLVPGTEGVDLKPTHYTECYCCKALVHNCKKVGDGIYSLWNQSIRYYGCCEILLCGRSTSSLPVV